MAGRLFLIPVTLGDRAPEEVIPAHIIKLTASLRYFAVENIRSARRYLRLIDKTFPVDGTYFYELSEHTHASDAAGFLKPLEDGNDMGLMSEAGLPGIADPGSLLVAAAHEAGIRVIPLPGPSSILLALVASGMNGQNFTFNGYLPVKPDERDRKLKEIEKASKKGVSQIFMETPYRNLKLLEAMLRVLEPETKLCIAAGITLAEEEIKTMKISSWKKKIPDLDKKPVVFIIGN